MVADNQLVELAAVVADGGTPDWASLEKTADGRQRSVISRLRTVSEIVRLHHTLTAGSSSVPAVRHLLEPGATWGDLRIIETIGSGRFGDVYRAFDPSLDREVALKILALQAEDLHDPTVVVEEGRLAAKVRHPNVVTIYGARTIGGQMGVWMELVRGRTLEAGLTESGPFGAEALTRVAVELGRALAAVHKAGLVHRDVKTTNAMRDADGRIVLGDFGTGRLHDEGDAARSGLAGTPPYLAPEIFDGKPATARSDIYSLGVLLFRLATGQFPVVARTFQGYRAAHEARTPVPVATLRSDLPQRLTAAIDRALSADPGDRFLTAAALVEAVRPRRRRWPSIAAAAVLAIALPAVTWWTTRQAPVRFQARDWVLVTAFDNRTNNRGLDAAIERALEDELRASTFANVVPRERVHDALLLMGRPPDARLDAALGREVGARDGGIRALVTGQVQVLGSSYVVAAQILAPDGSAIATINASDSNFFEVVGKLAAEIRRGLGETLPAVDAQQADLPRVSTRSLRALEQYAQAMEAFDDVRAVGNRQDQRSAVEQLLRSALAEDPDFAMAHLKLAFSIGQGINVYGRRDDAAAHATRALALSGRLADDERLQIVSVANLVLGHAANSRAVADGHFKKAEHAFLELLRQRPYDISGLTELATLYWVWKRPADEILMHLRIGEVRPNAFGWRAKVARLAFRKGDVDQAREYARAAARFLSPTDFEREPNDASWITLFPAIDAWLQGNAGLSLRLLDDAAQKAPTAPTSTQIQFVPQLVHMYLTLGRFEQAGEVAARLGGDPREQHSRLQLEALVAAERGDISGLRRLLTGQPPDATVLAGSLMLDAGLVEEWRRTIAYLRTTGVVRSNDYQNGLLALAEGRTADGERLLRSAIERDVSGSPARFRASIRLAALQRAAGDLPSAIATLNGASRASRLSTVEAWSLAYLWIRMRAALAALYREAGQPAEAETVERELRLLLAVADPGHPIQRQLDRTR